MTSRVGANKRGQMRQRRKSVKAKVGTHGRRIVVAGGWCLVVAAVVTGAYLGVRRLKQWARISDHFTVKHIEVSGNSRVGREQIVRMAGLTPGMQLFDVDPKAIRAGLANKPWVELVRVRRWAPGKVMVQIRERTPIALVNAGAVYQVDAEGVLFELPAKTYLSLPVVSGLDDTVSNSGQRQLTPTALKKLKQLRRGMALSDKAWYQHVSQVDFSLVGRIRLTLDGYPTAIEIDDGDVTQRMNQLKRLLEILAEEKQGSVRSIRFGRHNMAYVRR